MIVTLRFGSFTPFPKGGRPNFPTSRLQITLPRFVSKNHAFTLYLYRLHETT